MSTGVAKTYGAMASRALGQGLGRGDTSLLLDHLDFVVAADEE